MAEELEAPCTEEIAAFDKFIELASQGDWDVVVFDTAPTGHTMRLLELPIDWSKQIDVKVFGSVDSEWADEVAKRRFDDVIDMMRDSKRSTFAFVLYPESTPILEAHRAVEELHTVGIEPNLVVANYIIPRDQVDTPFVQARRSMQDKYMMEIDQRFSLPILQIPLLPYEIQGMERLKDLGDRLFGIRERMIQE
jgi:arsenite-transporting ATPase